MPSGPGLPGKDNSEVLVLLHRKADNHPLLPLLEESVRLIFASMRGRISAAAGPPQGS
jgi:hypothetical protein